MTVAKTIEAQARKSLRSLQAALRMAAEHPDKEKSIHDLRVAIRRFKQVLRVYAAYFDRTRKMRRALRGLMDLCGEARNCNVAVEVLEAAGVSLENSLKRDLRKCRREATRELAHELKHWHVHSDMRRWSQWLTAKSQEQPAAPPLPQLSKDFLKAGAAAAKAEAGYQQMHQFRLLVKKTRYASEILAAPQSQIELLRGLQDRLGGINDCVTTADLISDLKLRPAQQRRIKAALNRLAQTRSADFRIYWRGHFASKPAARRKR